MGFRNTLPVMVSLHPGIFLLAVDKDVYFQSPHLPNALMLSAFCFGWVHDFANLWYIHLV